MQKYETRITEWTVVPKGEPIFAERATVVTIEDEASGEYVEVSQEGVSIQIDPNEWPTLRAAIDHAIKQCRDVDGRQQAKNDG